MLGEVIGGDDVINSSVEGFSAFGFDGALYIGDVEDNDGYVTGGHDTIRGSNFPFIAERIVGDVDTNYTGGFLSGGADRLFGRAGQEFIAGDVYSLNGGTVIGGNDIIRAGEDSDLVAGDAFQSRPGFGLAMFNLTGGNDQIYGEGGNDWLIGDMWDLTEVDPASTLTGGNDRLYGGDGDDALYGDFGPSQGVLTAAGGNDTLDGGAGTDLLAGGVGNDTYVNPLGDTIVEAAGGGTDTVRSDAGFSLAGIAHVERLILTGTASVNGTGNELANLVTGNGGANRLRGLDGNDTIGGGGGNDTLEGGAGNDTLTGGSGGDLFRTTNAAAGTDRITDFQRGADRFDLGGGAFTSLVVAANGDTVLTHTGGKIRVEGISNLTLAQWNALVVPSGNSLAIGGDDGIAVVRSHGFALHPADADWMLA